MHRMKVFALSCLVMFNADVVNAAGDIAIRNSEIDWVFSPVGILWEYKGRTLDYAKRCNKTNTEELLEALTDKNRFAAAHFLLIDLYGTDKKHMPNVFDDDKADDIEFLYGLRVNFGVSPAEFDVRDRGVLREFWRRKLKREKTE